VRIAYLGPAGDVHRGCAARGRGRARLRAAAHAHRPRRDPRRPGRRGRPGAGPIRELDRGLGADDPGHARLRRRRSDDRRRARLRVHAHLIAREGVELEQVAAVLSHPQPLAQCARFLREHLPGSNGAASAAPPRRCGWSASRSRPWAAIGARAAAELYGCTCCAKASRTRPTTSPASSGSPRPGPSPRRGALEDLAGLLRARRGPSRAPGRGSAGVLHRGVNLTRIESRPLRQGLGRYMFFCDLEGALDDSRSRRRSRHCASQGGVGRAILGLRTRIGLARRAPA
jgi:prephenate dehydratase